MALRFYHDILIQIAEDLARENVLGTVDLEANQDQLLMHYGPTSFKVAAGDSDQQIAFPVGAGKLRFLVVYDVDNPNGVRVHEVAGAASGEQVLIDPPAEVDATGILITTCNWDALYLTNPDSGAEVEGKILMGFADS